MTDVEAGEGDVETNNNNNIVNNTSSRSKTLNKRLGSILKRTRGIVSRRGTGDDGTTNEKEEAEGNDMDQEGQDGGDDVAEGTNADENGDPDGTTYDEEDEEEDVEEDGKSDSSGLSKVISPKQRASKKIHNVIKSPLRKGKHKELLQEIAQLKNALQEQILITQQLEAYKASKEAAEHMHTHQISTWQAQCAQLTQEVEDANSHIKEKLTKIVELTEHRNRLLEDNDHLHFKLHTLSTAKPNAELDKLTLVFDEKLSQIKKDYEANLNEIIEQLKEALEATSKKEEENSALREEMKLLTIPVAATEHTEENVIEKLLQENLALKTSKNDLRVQVQELKLKLERLEKSKTKEHVGLFGKITPKKDLEEEDNFQRMADELRTNHDLLATQNENLMSEVVILRKRLFESEEKRQQVVERARQETDLYKAIITDLKLNMDLLNSAETGESDSLDDFYHKPPITNSTPLAWTSSFTPKIGPNSQTSMDDDSLTHIAHQGPFHVLSKQLTASSSQDSFSATTPTNVTPRASHRSFHDRRAMEGKGSSSSRDDSNHHHHPGGGHLPRHQSANLDSLHQMHQHVYPQKSGLSHSASNGGARAHHSTITPNPSSSTTTTTTTNTT